MKKYCLNTLTCLHLLITLALLFESYALRSEQSACQKEHNQIVTSAVVDDTEVTSTVAKRAGKSFLDVVEAGYIRPLQGFQFYRILLTEQSSKAP
jgi:hypothetical protein